MRHRYRLSLLLAALLAMLGPGAASGCSWPAITSWRDLSADFVFLVGTIGEPVQGGRVFHVERAWNASAASTTIVIAFNERATEAECGVTVNAGTRVFIAPFRGAGMLEANLATLQLDPDGEQGKAFIAEAVAMFGPGVAPAPAASPNRNHSPIGDGPQPLPALISLGGLVAACIILLAVRHRRRWRIDD